MKRENPEIVVTHCLAHRVELSFKDDIKSSKLYDKTITLLLGKLLCLAIKQLIIIMIKKS